mmetsp:Transcript_14537/g.46391  ORF Transcript_14537/g.46391 Transcript_14537/m.46391 type:complete len:234 (-) Transcript_14537:137-838(-)
MCHKLALALVHCLVGDLKGNRLIRLGRKEQVLVVAIGCFYTLLEGRHESVTWLESLLDFGIGDLEQQGALVGDWIALLDNLVPGPTDLDGRPHWNGGDPRRHPELRGPLACLARGSSRQVLLVPLRLCVRQVAGLGGVQSEAQLALKGAEMVAHEVRILGEVDRLHGQLSEALLPLLCFLCTRPLAHTARLRAPAVLTVHTTAKPQSELDRRLRPNAAFFETLIVAQRPASTN